MYWQVAWFSTGYDICTLFILYGSISRDHKTHTESFATLNIAYMYVIENSSVNNDI